MSNRIERVLLVNAITLLYRESQLPDNKEKSIAVAQKVVASVKIADVTHSLDHDTKIISGLTTLLTTMCTDPLDYQYEEIEILQRIRVISEGDDSVYDAIHEGITKELPVTTLKRICLNLRRFLVNYFRETEAIELMTKASNKLRFSRADIADLKKFLGEHIASLEPYTVDAVTQDPAIVSHVSLQNMESVENVYQSIQKEADGTEIIKCGYQGINRMLRGGFRYGDQVVIGALQHNYKTGFSLTLFKQFLLYNVPTTRDPTKKPLAIRISFEDDINLNMQFLFSNLKENEDGRVPSLQEINQNTPEEMSKYVVNRLTANGWYVDFLRVDPTRWSYIDLCNKIVEYESEGYEVKICMVDYLKMLPTTGCTQGASGQDIRDMFRRMRNFTNPRRILFVTPHQLSTEAKQLIRDGKRDFVKEIANKGYYDGCRTIDNEVDMELYIHIEKENGESYLTVQRGKHRIVGKTPDEDLYCVLKFSKDGGIPDDLLKADSSRRKVGGGVIGSGNEVPYWDHSGGTPFKRSDGLIQKIHYEFNDVVNFVGVVIDDELKAA